MNSDAPNPEASSGPRLLNFYWVLLYCVALPVGLVFMAFRFVIPEPVLPTDPVERAEALIRVQAYRPAAAILKRNLESRPFDVLYNRLYLRTHFQQPLMVGNRRSRNDDSLFLYYQTMCLSKEKRRSAYGCYYYGLAFSYANQYDEAQQYYELSGDYPVPYLNFSRAMQARRAGDLSAARDYLLREREISDGDSVVNTALAGVLSELRDWSGFAKLARQAELSREENPDVWRLYYLAHGQPVEYLRACLAPLASFSPWALLLSGIGVLIWAWLIRFWAQHVEFRILPLVAGFLGGILIVSCAWLAYDVVALFLDFRLRGTALNDLAFSIFGIGLIEEFMKFVPVLFVALIPGAIRKPVDWMLVATAAAIGFGGFEAFLFIHQYGVSIAIGRIFVSLPLHIMLSGCVGILVGEAGQRGQSVGRMLALGLGAAAVIHGLFDFALLGPFPLLRLFVFYLVIFLALAFSMGRNGLVYLSQSEAQEVRPDQGSVQTLVPFAAFALLCACTAIVVASSVSRDELLAEVLMVGMSSIGLLFTVFWLSLAPAARDWMPNWWRMNSNLYTIPEEFRGDHRMPEFQRRFALSDGYFVKQFLLGGFMMLAGSFVIWIFASGKFEDNDSISTLLLTVFMSGAMLLPGFAMIFGLRRAVKNLRIVGDQITAATLFREYTFSRFEFELSGADETGLVLQPPQGGWIRVPSSIQDYAIAARELCPPLETLPPNVARKIVHLKQTNSLWNPDLEENAENPPG